MFTAERGPYEGLPAASRGGKGEGSRERSCAESLRPSTASRSVGLGLGSPWKELAGARKGEDPSRGTFCPACTHRGADHHMVSHHPSLRCDGGREESHTNQPHKTCKSTALNSAIGGSQTSRRELQRNSICRLTSLMLLCPYVYFG